MSNIWRLRSVNRTKISCKYKKRLNFSTLFCRVEIILYLCIEIRIAQLFRARDANREVVSANLSSGFHNRRVEQMVARLAHNQ